MQTGKNKGWGELKSKTPTHRGRRSHHSMMGLALVSLSLLQGHLLSSGRVQAIIQGQSTERAEKGSLLLLYPES